MTIPCKVEPKKPISQTPWTVWSIMIALAAGIALGSSIAGDPEQRPLWTLVFVFSAATLGQWKKD